jgi:hypothetical protein
MSAQARRCGSISFLRVSGLDTSATGETRSDQEIQFHCALISQHYVHQQDRYRDLVKKNQINV